MLKIVLIAAGLFLAPTIFNSTRHSHFLCIFKCCYLSDDTTTGLLRNVRDVFLQLKFCQFFCQFR